MESDEGCDFFRSDLWSDRLRGYVGRAWDIEQAVAALTERPVAEVLKDLADARGVEKSTLYDSDLETLLAYDDTVIDATLDDAVACWREISDVNLPSTCPHPVEANGRCVFHACPDTVPDDRVREAFKTAIRTDQTVPHQFVGLTVDTLDLSRASIDADDEYPIDVRFSEVGRLDLQGAEIGQDFIATGTVVAEPRFAGVTFQGVADFAGAVLGTGPDNKAPASYSESVVQRDNFSEFAGDVSFRRASFGDKADFKRTTFGGDTSYNSATFGDIAMFNMATFAGGLDLMHAVFERKADFSKAQIGGYAVMNATYRSNAMFNYTSFGGQADFWNCSFHGMVDWWATTFDDHADFRYAEFADHASFKETTFADGCDFSRAQFEGKAVFDRVSAAEPLQLIEASIPKGRIVQPASGKTYYDFSDATLGDVRLQTIDEATPPLTRFRFLETDFDGFEFSRHRDALRGSWRLHTYNGDNKEPTVDELEVTYLRAKNGASDGGDSKAASEFFLREMRYRRKGNWNLALHSTGIRERVRGGLWWVTSWFYNLTCGYGERPLRTGLFSIAVVILFAVFYWASPLDLAADDPIAYATFSLQTLVTLIYGGLPTVKPLYVRLAASFEAFIGAFFIALFVFALTRSIHR